MLQRFRVVECGVVAVYWRSNVTNSLCLCSGVLSSIDTLNLPPEDAIPDERMPLESSWGKTPAEIVEG